LRVRFRDTLSQALEGGRGKEKETRGRSGPIRASPFLSLKQRFRRPAAATDENEKKLIPPPLLFNSNSHSALGDIGNLVAPLARVNVSQAEKARAQEVRKSDEGGRGEAKEKRPFVLRALAASTFSSLFFDERETSEKRARANDGSLGAGEKKGPWCSFCQISAFLLFSSSTQRGLSSQPSGEERARSNREGRKRGRQIEKKRDFSIFPF
jgi:hypothetical protein